MTEWRTTTLGEIILLQRGFDLTQESSPPGPYPVISSSGAGYTTMVRKVEGPGVVTGRKGVLGRVHFSLGPYWPHDTTLWVKDFKGSDPRFIYYLLHTLPLASLDAGASNPTLNRNHAHLLPVSVPDPETQRRISALLGVLDDLIDNSRRRIELLEQMAQGIYREWFVDFRYPGHDEVALVDSPLRFIPEGWTVKTFADIAAFVNGFAFKPEHWGDDGRPIIKIRELKQGVSPGTPRCHSRNIAQKYWVEPGDLLFSWSADLGAYRWSYEPGLLNQHLFTVIPIPGLSHAFLFRCLDEAMPQFRDRAQGTTMRHIKRAALSEVSTAVPPQALVDLFTEAVEPIDQQVISLRGASTQVAALRDLLLPALITGQIDVSNLDLDEFVDSLA